jgi:hypothetical protein
MENGKNTIKLESIFTLLLFAVFAGAVLLVLLLGVKSCRALAERGDAAYQSRTCVQYIAAKVRHSDSGGNVFVDDFSDDSDISTLFLAQEIDGALYYTRIYYYDGHICELFSLADAKVNPLDGNSVLESSGLQFNMDGNLLAVSASDENGRVTSLTLNIRSSGEAAQ